MTQVMNVVNRLRTHGGDITNQKVVEKVLRSLLVKFDVVVVTIKELKNLTQFSIEALMKSLLSHETWINIDDGSLENYFKS